MIIGQANERMGHISYSYTIALSGLFELYTRGGHLNHEAKPSGLRSPNSQKGPQNHNKNGV